MRDWDHESNNHPLGITRVFRYEWENNKWGPDKQTVCSHNTKENWSSVSLNGQMSNKGVCSFYEQPCLLWRQTLLTFPGNVYQWTERMWSRRIYEVGSNKTNDQFLEVLCEYSQVVCSVTTPIEVGNCLRVNAHVLPREVCCLATRTKKSPWE
jgi:hypothetical protein